MDRIEASTLVYLPPADVYEFLFDFTRYSQYSEYIDDVRVRGEGVGARFAIDFSWWKLGYTARGRVVDVDPPNRIGWEITRDIDANGCWAVEEVPDRAPPDRETASRVLLRIDFDADSADESAVGLPPLISLDAVFDRLKPVVVREGEKIARRVVADLEGHPRPVDLVIHEGPDTL